MDWTEDWETGGVYDQMSCIGYARILMDDWFVPVVCHVVATLRWCECVQTGKTGSGVEEVKKWKVKLLLHARA